MLASGEVLEARADGWIDLPPVVADLTRLFDPLRAIARLDIAEDGEGEFGQRKKSLSRSAQEGSMPR